MNQKNKNKTENAFQSHTGSSAPLHDSKPSLTTTATTTANTAIPSSICTPAKSGLCLHGRSVSRLLLGPGLVTQIIAIPDLGQIQGRRPPASHR